MEIAKSCSVQTLWLRMKYFYTVTGKDRGKCAWHAVLIDWNKKDQFLKKSTTGSIDVTDYGKILDSGWGHDIPQDILNKAKQFTDGILENFFLLRLEAGKCVQYFYVLAGVGKELEMRAAASVEEIRLCGKILYSSFDEDPPEALAYILEATYFGLKCDFDWKVDSPFFLMGELQDVQEYLNSGRDINLIDSRGWTLLHHFAHWGKMDVVRFLIAKQADIQMRDKICGRKPIHIAARESHNSVIELLLNNGASVNETDENNWTPMHYAVWKGNVKTVRLLIENNAEINAKDLTVGIKPIHIAAKYDHTDVVEALLANGVGIEEEDNDARSPLYYAAWEGHLETARVLILKGADIYKKTTLDTIPIHAATANKVIELLLDLGVSVDYPDRAGCTPLHRAVHQGHLELVQFLISKKANPNIGDKNAETPFDLSKKKKNTDVFLCLANKICTVFQEEENYSDALKRYIEMLKIQKEKLGPNHPETLKTINQEAKLLYKLGQYDAAVAKFKNVLETRERCLGGNHIDTLDTKYRLGLVYNAQIKYNEAMEIFKDVYEKREASLGAYHHDTLIVARDMASVHFRKGEHDEAYEIFKDVFEKRRAYFGADHEDTLHVQQDMAVVLVNKGDIKTAIQTFKDVLQKRKDTLGDNHPDTLLTKDHISLVSKRFETELIESNGCLIM